MKIKISITIILILILSACNIGGHDEDIQDIELSEKALKLIDSDNDFGLELFQRIYNYENDSENLMVSPISVALALAMTYNGANGDTKTAMEETLKLYGLSSEEINTSYQNLIFALKSMDEKVLLEIANAIFYKEGFSVEHDFISTNQNYYDAEISSLDFTSPDAINTINNWVADKTHDKIDKIIEEISPLHVMFLLNAIYFKGIWEKEFDEEETYDLPFYKENSESINVPMMCTTDTFEYTSNNLFQAIKLPYGSGNYNMVVFLPNDGVSLENIILEFNKENWENWLEDFQIPSQNIELKLPKFKFGYEIKLNDILTDMGMGIAFTGSADFTGINHNGGLCIDYVKHKTFIEVNEEGTEAAAVTIVGIRLTAITEPETIPFIVDKPFIFAITEKNTNAIMFVGTVKNPLFN